MVGFNYAPLGWTFCNGSLAPIAQYQALYALIGTTYGGNGVTTFGLPDMRGRFPMSMGQGPGLSNRVLGEQLGLENVTLTIPNLPLHTHSASASSTGGSATADPSNKVWSANAGGNNPQFAVGTSTTVPMGAAVSTFGTGGVPHSNIQRYLCVNFIIALEGIFPQPQGA